jgi:integrase
VSLKLVNRKGTHHYYLRGTVRGQAVFETTGTDDLNTAEALKIKREHELLHRSVFGSGATVTFLEAAVSYLEEGGEARFLGRFNESTGRWSLLIGHFANTPLAKVGQAEIDAAARALYPRGAAATRKRQVYAPMAAVMNHAASKKWVAPLRLKHPRVPPTETKYSTPERLETLLPHCSPKLRQLVVFLVYTGARISETLRLDWDRDVSLNRRSATLRRTKNGKPRTLHLADPVLVALSEVPENDRRGKVFKWNARHAVYGPLRRACAKAGVEYLPPHQQGRHTFASWLRIYSKRDLRGLMADGGWDSVQSVMRYAHLDVGETARAVDSLPTVQFPSSETIISAKSLKRNKK